MTRSQIRSQFRSFPADALRSDRSAGDRARHRQKVRQAIRDNIGDIVAEEAIIGRSGDRMVKVPIRGIREYRFVYGQNRPGVGTGEGGTEVGQSVGQGDQSGAGKGQGGNEAGQDYYETEISLEELIDIMFEDLALPDLERKKLRQLPSEHAFQRKGFRRSGIRAHLDKKRTAMARIRRQIAQGEDTSEDPAGESGRRFPFHKEDMIYRRLLPDTRPQSNAVVLCMMDTSGSMDSTKKYLARSFFFLLYQFVRSRYAEVELVFVAHHATAAEVTEEEFFHKGESGGTVISSAYQKGLEILSERYHPSLWNIYAFHCSDGDNFPGDNDKTVQAAEAICEMANLFGYGEIKPPGRGVFESSMLETFSRIRSDCFHALTIHGKEDIWPGLKAFLQKDRAAQAAGPEVTHA